MEYAARKNGKPFEVLPILQTVFKDTYGILVYQEQCCVADTIVRTENGNVRLLDLISDVEKGKTVKVSCLNDEGDLVFRSVVQTHRNGKRAVYKVRLDNGLELVCTEDERVLTSNRGWVQVQHLLPDDDVTTMDDI